MGSEWRRVQVSEVCEVIVDCVNKTAPITDEPTPFKMLRTTNIKAGRIDRNNCNRVTPETFKVWTRRCEVKRGDVILTREAPVGEVGYVSFDDTVFLGQRLMQYRANPSVLDSRFLLYSFLSKDLKDQFAAHDGSGSTVSHIRVGDCSKFQLTLPPLAEQRAIAHVLGTLDDLIELNRETNEILEEMARALFKSWFVDFDPVRAKLEGRQPEGMDAATAALFPDHFQDSELGQIPKGWKVKTIECAYNLTMGQSPPGETYNTEGNGLPFYQGSTDFGFRFPSLRVYCDLPKRKASAADTLVSVRAPVGDLNMAYEECCIGRGIAAIRHKTGASSYTFYSMESLKPSLDVYNSEGTVFGCLSKKAFSTLKAIEPSPDVLLRYERFAQAFDCQINVLEQESRDLAALRDTLLPKLLSGEITVPTAEGLIAAATK